MKPKLGKILIFQDLELGNWETWKIKNYTNRNLEKSLGFPRLGTGNSWKKAPVSPISLFPGGTKQLSNT